MKAPTKPTGSKSSKASVSTELSTDEQRVSFLSKAWRTVSAVFGTSLGLLPHVLHHTGLIFGAALVTGAGGNVSFAALGLLFSVPLLRRLYTRFHTWKAPAIALAIFVAMFSLSAFVIGPAIAGDSSAETPSPAQTTDHSSHDGH
ncbi:hypothetical protein BH09ACT10_BH09ACT10_03970 [soil metagenome]